MTPTPVAVSDLEVAFGGSPLLMPRFDAIPDEFRVRGGAAKDWIEIVDGWRTVGVKSASGLVPAGGISPGAALRHVAAIISNREIPREDADTAAAWLLSVWFSPRK